jgi:hypothetical protein
MQSTSRRERMTTGIRLAVDNTLANEAMLAAVQTYGYDRDQMEAVRDRLEVFLDAVANRSETLGRQVGTTAELGTKLRTFRRGVYIRHLQLARRLFRKNPAAITSLQLSGSREPSREGWIGQARTFYTNALANPEYQEVLATRNLTTEDLQAGLDWVQRIYDKKALQKQKKGKAVSATRTRTELEEELADWYSLFSQVAKWSFEANPQWLVKIGLRAGDASA